MTFKTKNVLTGIYIFFHVICYSFNRKKKCTTISDKANNIQNWHQLNTTGQHGVKNQML